MIGMEAEDLAHFRLLARKRMDALTFEKFRGDNAGAMLLQERLRVSAASASSTRPSEREPTSLTFSRMRKKAPQWSSSPRFYRSGARSSIILRQNS